MPAQKEILAQVDYLMPLGSGSGSNFALTTRLGYVFYLPRPQIPPPPKYLHQDTLSPHFHFSIVQLPLFSLSSFLWLVTPPLLPNATHLLPLSFSLFSMASHSTPYSPPGLCPCAAPSLQSVAVPAPSSQSSSHATAPLLPAVGSGRTPDRLRGIPSRLGGGAPNHLQTTP